MLGGFDEEVHSGPAFRQSRSADISSDEEEGYANAMRSNNAAAAAARPASGAPDWDRLVRERMQDSDGGGDDDDAMRGADVGDVIKDNWEFFDFDQEDWSDIIEEYTDDPDYCYFCECGQSDRELEGNPQLRDCNTFLAENYSKMTRKKLAMQGQRIFNAYLRPYSKSKKPMRCQTIINHIERHAPTTRIQLEHQNRTLNHCVMEQARQLRQKEQTSNKTRLSKPDVSTYGKLIGWQNDVIARLSKVRPDAKK